MVVILPRFGLTFRIGLTLRVGFIFRIGFIFGIGLTAGLTNRHDDDLLQKRVGQPEAEERERVSDTSSSVLVVNLDLRAAPRNISACT